MDEKTPWDKLSSEIYCLQFTNFHCLEQESVSHFKDNFYSECFGFCFLVSVNFYFLFACSNNDFKVCGWIITDYLSFHS